jgi:hypothetical protein
MTIGLAGRAVRLARTAGQMPSAYPRWTVTSALSVRTSASKVIPVEVSAAMSLASGAIGGSRVANGHGAHGTREPHRQTACAAQHDQLTALQVECDQRRVFPLSAML